MATTISPRLVVSDDSGTADNPVGDGDTINNDVLQDLQDIIDGLIGANILFGGTVSAEGFGTHSFSAGGTGGNQLTVRNPTAGTGNFAQLSVGSDIADQTTLTSFASTHATGPNLSILDAAGSAGLQIRTLHASGTIVLSTGGAGAARLTIGASGVIALGTGVSITTVPLGDGSVSTPSLAFASDLNTGIYRSAADTLRVVAGGTAVLTLADDSVGWPTVTIPGIAATNAGPTFTVERNSSGGGAPGILSLYDKAGTRYYLWVDSTGDVRVGTTAPSVAGGDTGGTVVGTQS